MIKLLLVLFFLTTGIQALEIDAKLTVRILQVSNSQKTVLINQGAEEAIKVGDHAKFSIATGLVARGVVVKSSPARSVWSIYDLVTPEHLVKDAVMVLKITYPVKITDQTIPAVPAAKEGKEVASSELKETPKADDSKEESVADEASEEQAKDSDEEGKDKKLKKVPPKFLMGDAKLIPQEQKGGHHNYVDTRGIDFSHLNDVDDPGTVPSNIDYSGLNENLNEPFVRIDKRVDYSNLDKE